MLADFQPTVGKCQVSGMRLFTFTTHSRVAQLLWQKVLLKINHINTSSLIAVGLSGVQFNLMTMGVILVAEIGWHEVLSPIKCKTTTTTSMIFLLGQLDLRILFFSVFPNLVPRISDLPRLRLSFPNYFLESVYFVKKKKCYGVLFFSRLESNSPQWSKCAQLKPWLNLWLV